MNKAINISLCVLAALPLFACSSTREKPHFNADVNPNMKSHPLARHYAFYEPPNYNPTNEIFNGYATGMPGTGHYENLYLKERLWDGNFQKGLDQGIRSSATGSPFNWKEGNYIYKFKSKSELYYATYTQTLCREGTVSWNLQNVYGAGWSDYSALFCQIGPQQEWLPVR